jgi:hypothetical protein
MHMQCRRAAPRPLERGDASVKVDGPTQVARWQSRYVQYKELYKLNVSSESSDHSDVAGDAEESLKCLECNIARKAAMIPKESRIGMKRVMDGRS